MRALGEAGYILAKRELIFIAAITGAKEIFGIQDDTHTLREDKLKSEWERAKDSLDSKKYIELEIDGTITIDEDLMELVKCCCNPKTFIDYKTNDERGKTHQKNWYLGEDFIAELDEHKNMRDTYVLTRRKNIEELVYDIGENCKFEQKFEKGSTAIKLSKKELETLMDNINKEEKELALSSLIKYGKEEDIRSLIKSMMEKKIFRSLYILNLSEESVAMKGFTLYSDGDRLWSINIKNGFDIKNLNNDFQSHIKELDNDEIYPAIKTLMADGGE